MPRSNYRNGDSISLPHAGCNDCSPLMVNGVLCHEPGCREAWRDQEAECFECGCDFTPEEKPSRYSLCPDCQQDRE